MDYTVYTAVKNQFTAHPNLCDLFKLLSIETWKRIEYAYARSRVKVFETTLTQNLIFSINAYNDQFKLNIEILEAEDENTNGNDIELVIRFPSRGLEFYAPIQAKKVYKKGRYDSMDHGVQIDSLISYAQRKNAIPFYLLYNFTPLPPWKGLGTPPEWNGCTLVTANHLFNHYYNKRHSAKRGLTWKIPSFYDLHPAHAFCWHEIVCPSNPDSLLERINAKAGGDELLLPQSLEGLTRTGMIDNPTSFFPIDTFKKDDKWRSVEQLKVVDPFSEERTSKLRELDYDLPEFENTPLTPKQLKGGEEEKPNPEFAPKSRLILTQSSKG